MAHETFESLFLEIEKNMNEVLINEISQELITIWTQLLYDNFYAVYSPHSYNRTFQILSSLSVLNVSKSGSGKTYVSIGYDMKSLEQGLNNGVWNQHEDPKLDMRIEVGYKGGVLGHDPSGIHAIDEMYVLLNSPKFKEMFNQKMRVRGFIMS